jgi:FkbM family methyltransferase
MRPEAYEPAVAGLLVHHLYDGATVVDVGAHVGLHTLMFSCRVGAAGHVIAVEPSPANADLLRLHLVWNDRMNVTVIEAVVGDHEGAIEFAYRADAADPGGFANSIVYDIGGLRKHMPMTTLDAICKGLLPDLVKIDVEGAELLVLRGAEETLARSAPILVVAVHPEPLKMLGSTPTELVAFLSERDYQGRDLDGRWATNPGFEEIVFEKKAAAAL